MFSFGWIFTIVNSLRNLWNRWMNETKLSEQRLKVIDDFKQIMKMPQNNIEGYGTKTRFIVKDSGGHEFYSTYYNQLQDLRCHIAAYFDKQILKSFDNFIQEARSVFMIYIEDDKVVISLFTADELSKHRSDLKKKYEFWESSILKYEKLIKIMEKTVE